jgi:hypothetical protein
MPGFERCCIPEMRSPGETHTGISMFPLVGPHPAVDHHDLAGAALLAAMTASDEDGRNFAPRGVRGAGQYTVADLTQGDVYAADRRTAKDGWGLSILGDRRAASSGTANVPPKP